MGGGGGGGGWIFSGIAHYYIITKDIVIDQKVLAVVYEVIYRYHEQRMSQQNQQCKQGKQ